VQHRDAMSASHAPALDAIAFQLAAALDSYELDVAEMLATWPDLQRYRDVSEQVERIRMYSAELPVVRVQWVELLIAHAELIHMLWRAQYANSTEARSQIDVVREHHADAIRSLRARCLRFLGRRDVKGPAARG
jgi:hypothetical protein